MLLGAHPSLSVLDEEKEKIEAEEEVPQGRKVRLADEEAETQLKLWSLVLDGSEHA